MLMVHKVQRCDNWADPCGQLHDHFILSLFTIDLAVYFSCQNIISNLITSYRHSKGIIKVFSKRYALRLCNLYLNINNTSQKCCCNEIMP